MNQYSRVGRRTIVHDKTSSRHRGLHGEDGPRPFELNPAFVCRRGNLEGGHTARRSSTDGSTTDHAVAGAMSHELDRFYDDNPRTRSADPMPPAWRAATRASVDGAAQPHAVISADLLNEGRVDYLNGDASRCGKRRRRRRFTRSGSCVHDRPVTPSISGVSGQLRNVVMVARQALRALRRELIRPTSGGNGNEPGALRWALHVQDNHHRALDRSRWPT